MNISKGFIENLMSDLKKISLSIEKCNNNVDDKVSVIDIRKCHVVMINEIRDILDAYNVG